MKKTKEDYKYYLDYRTYLIRLIHLNEVFTHSIFVLLLIILYIFWIKTDILSYFLLIIFCLIILDWIKSIRKTQKFLIEWDEKNN